ncbi:MAG: histone deacetylase [Spirochaetota bacterium]|nr:histone deacetylase [Spirochaetota bacterium]
MSQLGFIYDPIFLTHDTGRFHPERPSRLEAILRQLKRDGLDTQLVLLNAYDAPLEWIKEIHDEDYINRVKSASEAETGYLDSQDCPVSQGTYQAAIRAAGALLSAVDKIMDASIRRAFCAVRPPGHHAERNRAMGFCFFNNVAIAARYIQKKYAINKVFILDWDVHHGNGTQHSFEKDDSVYYCSLHQDPSLCYPGTGYPGEVGSGVGKGFTLNIPLTPATEDKAFLEIFEREVLSAIDSFSPDFILISAGFDAHKDDPLAQLSLTESAFSTITKQMLAMAEKHCEGRLVSVLEGGYNLLALGNTVSAHIKELI